MVICYLLWNRRAGGGGRIFLLVTKFYKKDYKIGRGAYFSKCEGRVPPSFIRTLILLLRTPEGTGALGCTTWMSYLGVYCNGFEDGR